MHFDPVGDSIRKQFDISEKINPKFESDTRTKKKKVYLVGPIFKDRNCGGVAPPPFESEDLFIADIAPVSRAPYKIGARGRTVGWAPESSLDYNGTITVGLEVEVN